MSSTILTILYKINKKYKKSPVFVSFLASFDVLTDCQKPALALQCARDVFTKSVNTDDVIG